MGSFNATCHLSSLPIKEDEDIIAIPVHYGHIFDNHLAYDNTNSSCEPAFLPLFGKYNGFGSIILNPDSNAVCDYFRHYINDNLMNSEIVRQEKAKSRNPFSKRFYLFKREKYSDLDNCEFYSDSEYKKLATQESRYYNTSEITDNQDLMDYLSIGGLININQSVERFSFIFIKKSIYNQLVTAEYKGIKAKIKKNINTLVKETVSHDFFENIGFDTLSKASLHINLAKFSGQRLLSIVNSHLYNKKSLEQPFSNILNAIPDWAILCGIYSDLGKTYYPNVSFSGSGHPIKQLSQFIVDEIDTIRIRNRNYWSVENGYCEDQSDIEEWYDYIDL